MQGTMMEADLTLTQLFERAVRLFGDREITSRLPDRSLFTYRYSDLKRRSRSLAAALLQAGLRPGDRVATLMFNHSVHLEAYFGIPLAGEPLTDADLFRLTGRPIATWQTARVRGGGPEFLKVGRRVVYPRPLFLRWLYARLQRSTSDPGPAAEAAR